MRAPGGEQVGVDAAAHDHVEDLPRARRDGQVELGRHATAPQHGRDDREILERRVDRGADAHLPRRLPGRLAHGHDVPRRRGQRDQRLEVAEVDRLRLVVQRARVGGQLDASAPRGPGRRATCASARRRGRSPSSRRSPSPCCRSSRDRSRSASRRRPRGTRRCTRARRVHPAAGAARARRPSTAPTAPAGRGARPRRRTGLSTTYGPPAIATATSVAPGSDREHPERARHRRVRVGADEHAARAARTARGAGSGRSRSPAASRARRTASPSCGGTRGPPGCGCRTGSRCGRRTRRVGTATRSRPSCSNWRHAIVPVASSSRISSTRELDLLVALADQVVGDDLLRERLAPWSRA